MPKYFQPITHVKSVFIFSSNIRGESTLNIEYSPDGKKKNIILILLQVKKHILTLILLALDSFSSSSHGGVLAVVKPSNCGI